VENDFSHSDILESYTIKGFGSFAVVFSRSQRMLFIEFGNTFCNDQQLTKMVRLHHLII